MLKILIGLNLNNNTKNSGFPVMFFNAFICFLIVYFIVSIVSFLPLKHFELH